MMTDHQTQAVFQRRGHRPLKKKLQPLIDAYSFGRITVGSRTFRSDVIIYPDRVKDSWWRKEGHHLCLDDIREVLDYHPEALVVGTGNPGLMKVPSAVRIEITSRGIELAVLPTQKAVKKFNAGITSSRRIVAALHITC
jgi:hypothetical protein